MKPIRMNRRQLLGGLLAAPVVSVTGCGGTDSSPGFVLPAIPRSAGLNSAGPVPAAESMAPAGQVKQVLVYYVYDGDELIATQDNLPTVASNVTTTADRFADGSLCYQFDGVDSSVTVQGIEGGPTGSFALLLWVRSSTRSQMELLRITGTDGRILAVEVNGPGLLLSVAANGSVVAGFAAGNGIDTVADGSWHHLALQAIAGAKLQLFVDGVLRGEVVVAQPIPSDPSVLIGHGWAGAIDDVRLYNCAFSAPSIPQRVYAWTPVKADTSAATGNLAAYFPFTGGDQDYLEETIGVTATAVTPTVDRFGSSGAAYLFNGSNSCITLNTGFESTAGDFAVGFWEQSSASGAMTAFSASSGGIAGTGLDIVFNQGTAVQVYLNGVPAAGLSAGTSGGLTDGNWHFVFLQRAAGVMQLYVDGALSATASNASIFFGSASVMQFGCGSGASAAVSQNWNGALDDVQIYEVSLTQAQIASLLGLAFLGRDGAGALTFQGKMWLLGGWNGSYVPDTNSEVWSSADGVNWTLATVAPWPRRHDAGYAVLNNRMWIVGGDRNTGNYQNDVWSSADGVNWEQVTNNVPWANRATHYVLAFNGRLWLMGGQEIFESAPPYVVYNDVWSSADGADWQLEAPHAPWSPRGLIMGSVVFQGRMWVIGGGQYDLRTFNNDVWSSADGVNWQQVLAQAPWSPRQFHNVAVFDNKIWVLAGGDAESQGGLNDVWYSTDGSVWTQLAGTPWIARHAASTHVYNNGLWLSCGSDANGDNDVWKMSYAS